ncbi:xanthine dehydrogenase [Anopheles sinensis]|uniref:Xanthine dehydrogenase n=1 Tax=Anopheles sinensis TaxID=74873 RepID=A0A084VKR6_ANOSI|nr:xanthine dehydrogenase [Anopheles sinensis]
MEPQVAIYPFSGHTVVILGNTNVLEYYRNKVATTDGESDGIPPHCGPASGGIVGVPYRALPGSAKGKHTARSGRRRGPCRTLPGPGA